MSFTVPTGYTMYRLKGDASFEPTIQNTYSAGTTVSDSPYHQTYSTGSMGGSYSIRDVLVYNDTGLYYSYNSDGTASAGFLHTNDWDIGYALNRDCSADISNSIETTVFGSVTVVDVSTFSNEALETVYLSFYESTRVSNITFSSCTNLESIVFSNIPTSVTTLYFSECTSLTTFPTIPSTVTDLTSCFQGCTSLAGYLTINANPTDYDDCFADTTESIRLMGSSTILSALAATGNNGNVVVASVALNFTTVTGALTTSVSWNDMLYANNIYVAVGDGKAAYSSDGINWTETTPFDEDHTFNLAYGNGVFMTIAYDSSDEGVAYTSSDGINWTKKGTLTNSSLYTGGLAFGMNKFVFVGGLGTNQAYYSTDGATWTQTSSSIVRQLWSRVVYNNNKFIAWAFDEIIGGGGTFYAIYSTDGMTWATLSVPSTTLWARADVVNGMFTLCSYSSDIFATSTDGINWNNTYDTPYPVVYGGGLYLGRYDYNTHKIMCNNDFTTIWDLTNVDESTWPNWNAMIFNNGKFILLCSNGTIAYSNAVSITLYIKESNEWVDAQLRIKQNNTWTEPSSLLIKQNNIWTEI